MSSSDYNVTVIGSGVGGMVAAAQLALQGRKPLILEATDRLGGRFSTIEHDGYKIPTGAIAIETSGPFYETFQELGIDPDLRVPRPAVRVRIRGHEMTAGAPAWEHMIKRVSKTAGKVAVSLREGGGDLTDELMLSDWAGRYTRSKTIASLFQSLAASMFTVNADELPARAFFSNLRETGGYKSFGFAPNGNVAIANAMAQAIEDLSGEVRRGWRCVGIEIENGRAVAVRATDPSGVEHRITADAVISDVGPRNTARLVKGTEVEQAFADRVAGTQPTSMIALSFSTDEDILPKVPGMINFTDTRRLCSLGNLTAVCPNLAPPGKHLYDAYSVPRPAVGHTDYDEEAERELLESDLREHVPGYAEKATVVHFKAMRGDATPAQQSAPGNEPPSRTPVPNLIDVGDGCKPPGWIGTSGCAKTARLGVDALLADERFAAQPAAV
jgi:phytoene dehydrogenase-like protein